MQSMLRRLQRKRLLQPKLWRLRLKSFKVMQIKLRKRLIMLTRRLTRLRVKLKKEQLKKVQLVFQVKSQELKQQDHQKKLQEPKLQVLQKKLQEHQLAKSHPEKLQQKVNLICLNVDQDKQQPKLHLTLNTASLLPSTTHPRLLRTSQTRLLCQLKTLNRTTLVRSSGSTFDLCPLI